MQCRLSVLDTWKTVLTKEILVENYITNGLTRAEIIKKFNLPDHVLSALISHYEIKKQTQPVFITEDELYQKYIIEDLTFLELSEYFKLSRSYLTRLLKKYNIKKTEHKRQQIDINEVNRKIQEGKTNKQISEEMGVSTAILYSVMRDYRSTAQIEKADKYKDRLIELYVEKGHTIVHIGKELFLAPSTVSLYLKALNLTRVDNRLITSKISIELLKEEYLQNNMTLSEICKKYDLSSPQNLYRFMRQHGIPRRRKGSRLNNYEDISISYFNTIIQRSKDRSLDFDLTREYLWDLFIKQDGKCNLSGLDINLVKSEHHLLYTEQTASLDRIDSSKGYVYGNVQWVHKDFNRLKWDLDEPKLFELCKTLYLHLKEKYE